MNAPLYFFISLTPGSDPNKPHIGSITHLITRCEEHAPAEAKNTKLVDAAVEKWARCEVYHPDWRCQVCHPRASS